MGRRKPFAVSRDANDRVGIEFYEGTHNREYCVRFIVIGANGERQAPSEPYLNIANAVRGVRDLYERLHEMYEPKEISL